MVSAFQPGCHHLPSRFTKPSVSRVLDRKATYCFGTAAGAAFAGGAAVSTLPRSTAVAKASLPYHFAEVARSSASVVACTIASRFATASSPRP